MGSLELIDPMEGEVHDGRLEDGSPPEVTTLVRWGSGLWLHYCGRLRSRWEGGKVGCWAAGLLVGSGILLGGGLGGQELAWSWPAIGRPASKPRNRGWISAGIGPEDLHDMHEACCRNTQAGSRMTRPFLRSAVVFICLIAAQFEASLDTN